MRNKTIAVLVAGSALAFVFLLARIPSLTLPGALVLFCGSLCVFLFCFAAAEWGLHLLRIGSQRYSRKFLADHAQAVEQVFGQITALQLLYLRVIGMTFIPLMVYLFSHRFVLGLLCAIPCYFLPGAVMRLLWRRRRARFARQFVEALTMMSSALKAGMALPRAVEEVVDEMPPPISQEFGFVLSEMHVGRRLDEALSAMARRLQLKELDLTVTAINVALRMGGNLNQIFESITHTIRNRDAVLEKVKTYTSSSKLSGYFIGCIPVFFLLVLNLLRPDFVSILFHSPQGNFVLGVALILEAMGFVMLIKLAKVRI